MISYKLKNFKKIWFARELNPNDRFKFTMYKQAELTKNIFGFVRVPFYTLLIDLTENIDILFKRIKKNTKYKINRASREGIKFAIHEDIDTFIDYYNKFATLKGLSQLKKDELIKLNQNLIITKAINEDSYTYVMHSYVCDKELKKVRLFHSASFYESDDKKIRNLVGMANRFLHFEDIKYFKANGYEQYDFGGYAYNTQDKHLQNINDFKAAFGGVLVEQSDYYSYPLYLALKFKKLLGK